MEHPGLCLCSLSIDLLSGNATSLDEQVGQCLQACEPEASAAPPPRLHARETFGGRVAAPPPLLSPPSLSTSPNTVVHEYGWQARIPGIINVPRGHINHITIKRPNAPKKCRDAIAHGRSREGKQFLRGGTRGCSRSAASSEIRALAILLCSCVAALTASNVSCDKAGCSYTRVRFILAEMLTGTRAQLQLT